MNETIRNHNVLSTDEEIFLIGKILESYLRLPFSPRSIPGSIMEHVLGNVRNAKVLDTYDFVDVIDSDAKIGWQIKSRKKSTPVTWKRAKISNKVNLISDSEKSEEGMAALGAAIMDLCNVHLSDSIEIYDLEHIGYIDLILHKDKIEYIECEIPKDNLQQLFRPSDFRWQWSSQRKGGKKEQLSALHGFHIATGERWWAWHGRGENQLHFVGEEHWISSLNSTRRDFRLPSEEDRVSINELLEMFEGKN